MQNSISKQITDDLNVSEHVIVYTQSADTMRDFLVNEPGRWSVQVNPMFWQSPEHKKIGHGPGYKVSVSDSLAAVGLDCDAKRIVFTKRPLIPKKGSTIVKEYFSYPKFKIVDSYASLVAVKNYPQLFIRAEDNVNYNFLHDQLSMAGVHHSVDTEEPKDVMVSLSGRPKPGMVALLYGFHSIMELMRFHECSEIILVNPINNITPPLRSLQYIMAVFNENPASVLSTEYIAFRTMANPETVKKHLRFLMMSGCVKRARADNQQITINKKTSVKAIEYQMIPEGTHTISKLISHLRIQRHELFPLLKKYEGDLIFSYLPAVTTSFWVAIRDMTEATYFSSKERFQVEQQDLINLQLLGSQFINEKLDRMIERYCVSSKARATLWRAGVCTVIDPVGNMVDIPSL